MAPKSLQNRPQEPSKTLLQPGSCWMLFPEPFLTDFRPPWSSKNVVFHLFLKVFRKPGLSRNGKRVRLDSVGHNYPLYSIDSSQHCESSSAITTKVIHAGMATGATVWRDVSSTSVFALAPPLCGTLRPQLSLEHARPPSRKSKQPLQLQFCARAPAGDAQADRERPRAAGRLRACVVLPVVRLLENLGARARDAMRDGIGHCEWYPSSGRSRRAAV